MDIKQIEQCDNVQELTNELEVTRNQIFASQKFNSGFMFIDAKSRQNAILERVKAIARARGES